MNILVAFLAGIIVGAACMACIGLFCWWISFTCNDQKGAP